MRLKLGPVLQSKLLDGTAAGGGDEEAAGVGAADEEAADETGDMRTVEGRAAVEEAGVVMLS